MTKAVSNYNPPKTTFQIEQIELQNASLSKRATRLFAEKGELKNELNELREKVLQQRLFVTELYEHHKITAAELRKFGELSAK